jgi:hypothetical protein
MLKIRHKGKAHENGGAKKGIMKWKIQAFGYLK